MADVHNVIRWPDAMSMLWSMPSTDSDCCTDSGVPLVNVLVISTVCPISIGAYAVFWASLRLANVVDTLVKRGRGCG